MPDKNDKHQGQVPGKYYVDSQCINCDLCRKDAPDNFAQNEEGGFSYVFKQPETPEEVEACEIALEHCPVDAIGDVLSFRKIIFCYFQ